ncbi:CocE/NonD family hydrolase [Chloroflexota bacterium]
MNKGKKLQQENNVEPIDAVIGTGKISPRQYSVIRDFDVYAPVSDGVNINLDVFRPSGNEKYPALISISPYNKEAQYARVWPRAMGSSMVRGQSDASLEAGPTEFLVRRGYVHIIASTRGTGKSEGTYRFMDLREIQDIHDLVEWAAKQPWCNGQVGMMGTSYYAWSQQRAAVLQPPHLKAICPFYSSTDLYRDLWYHGGILKLRFLNMLLSTGALCINSEASVTLEELGEEGYRKAIAQALLDKDLMADPGFAATLTNPDMPGNAAKLDVLLHPTDGPYWQERRLVDYDKITIPAYLGCCWGMYELHLPAAFRSWENLQIPKKLVIGPPIYLDRPVHQYSWEMLRWYDYWLKGIDTGIMDEPPVKVFIIGANEWKIADDWPIPGTKWIPFNLHSGGILSEMEPWPDASPSSYEDSPAKRGSLVYCTPALVENTEVIGPIALNLYASCRSNDINFCISLWDVDQQGNETIITRGWLKGSHREIDPAKSKPWRPFHTHKDPKPLVPGEIYKFAIEIIPTACLFKAGHKICLKIKGVIDEEPKTTLQFVHAPHISRQARDIITVYQDADHPSHILLPITKGNVVGTFISGGDLSLHEPKFD